MAQLPLFKLIDPAAGQMQTRWKSLLDALLGNKLVQGNLVFNQTLVTGVNVINHGLGRTQVGWSIVDQTGPSEIYRSQSFNSLTLTLNSSAPTVVSVWCF